MKALEKQLLTELVGVTLYRRSGLENVEPENEMLVILFTVVIDHINFPLQRSLPRNFAIHSRKKKTPFYH